jgi:hypothetical protein
MRDPMRISTDCRCNGCPNGRVRGTLYCPLHQQAGRELDDVWSGFEASRTEQLVDELAMDDWLNRSCGHGMLLGVCHLSARSEFPGMGRTSWQARDAAAAVGVFFS